MGFKNNINWAFTIENMLGFSHKTFIFECITMLHICILNYMINQRGVLFKNK